MNGSCLLERKALLRRYFISDQDLIALGKRLGLASVEGKTYLLSEEVRSLIETIAKSATDTQLVEAFEFLRPKPALDTPDFRGQYYTVRDGKLERGGAHEDVKRNIIAVLENAKTEERALRRYAFLLALAELCKRREDYWLHHWDGPPLREVLRKMDEVLGTVGSLPAPQDYLVLSAYGLYYKGGSNKYPAHCMPVEIIPAVERALKEWMDHFQRSERTTPRTLSGRKYSID